MGTELLSEYRVSYADNHSEIFMAKNMLSVVKVKENPTVALAQITRLRTGVGVETPIRPVKFNLTVLPETAADNGCHATPVTWVVPEDTKVIFTACKTEGFEFVGWFKKGETTALSVDEVVEILVEYPDDPTALAAEFEAHFQPIGPITP